MMLVQYCPFFALRVVSLCMFVVLMRKVRRQWAHLARPMGKRTLKRLKREAPQVLHRLRLREYALGKVLQHLDHHFQVLVPICAECFCYYAGATAETRRAWFAAAVCLQARAMQWHAGTSLQCKGFSLCFAVVMAEKSFWKLCVGCSLAMLSPWFPLACHRCGESNHNADNCPHFPQERDLNVDAWSHFHNAPALEEGAGDNMHLVGALIERQPGDGHCLFHSLAAGLCDIGEQSTGENLREELAEWLWTHEHIEVAGNTFAEWIHHDSQMTVHEYCAMMSCTRECGGGIEIKAFTILKEVNVDVYERGANSFHRIACVTCPSASDRTISVLYVSRCHYDLLRGGVMTELTIDSMGQDDVGSPSRGKESASASSDPVRSKDSTINQFLGKPRCLHPAENDVELVEKIDQQRGTREIMHDVLGHMLQVTGAVGEALQTRKRTAADMSEEETNNTAEEERPVTKARENAKTDPSDHHHFWNKFLEECAGLRRPKPDANDACSKSSSEDGTDRDDEMQEPDVLSDGGEMEALFEFGIERNKHWKQSKTKTLSA